MPEPTDSLILSISADVRSLQRSLNTAQGLTKKAAKGMEDSFSQAGEGMAKSMNGVQAASKNLSFQLIDISSGLLSGQSPFIIMAQQSGQVIQALGGISSAAGGLRASLGAIASAFGPAALVTALTLATQAAASYFTTVDEGSKDAERALAEHLAALGRLADAYRDLDPAAADALDKVATAHQQAADMSVLQKELERVRKEAIAELIKGVELLDNTVRGKARDAFGLAGAAEQLAPLDAKIETVRKKISDGTVTAEDFKAVMDEVARLNVAAPGAGFDKLGDVLRGKVNPLLLQQIEYLNRIKGLHDAIGAAAAHNAEQANYGLTGPLPSIGAPVQSGAGVFDPSQTQQENYDKAKEEAKKAAEEAAKAAKNAAEKATEDAKKLAEDAAKALTEAILKSSAMAVEGAAKWVGKDENANRGEINAFLKAGGVDLDAATQSWCAAFVNSALAQVGIKGSGSQVATSFGGWGKAVDLKNLQPGDVAVQMRGHGVGEAGGHVGFATGQVQRIGEEITKVEIIAGNSSDKVAQYWVDATSVMVRRSEDASQDIAKAFVTVPEKTDPAAKKMQDQWQQVMGLTQSAISGFISDIRKGVDAGEAFTNMLDKIISGLIDMSLQMAFGKTGLGALFSGGTAVGGVTAPVGHRGGVVGQFGGDGRRFSPALWNNAERFHRGGIVGLRSGEVPIIAKRGELVVPSSAIGKRGASQINDNRSNVRMGNLTIDMGGKVQADDQQGKEFGLHIQRIVQRELVSESRAGGLLHRAGRA